MTSQNRLKEYVERLEGGEALSSEALRSLLVMPDGDASAYGL